MPNLRQGQAKSRAITGTFINFTDHQLVFSGSYMPLATLKQMMQLQLHYKESKKGKETGGNGY